MKRYVLVGFLMILILKSFGQCSLSATITASNPAICSGNSVLLTAKPSGGTPAYSYIWSTGEITASISVNKSGTYSVTVKDNTLGCPGVIEQITIGSSTTPASPDAADATTCPNSSATLTASGSTGIYQWYDASTGGNLLYTGSDFTTPILTNSTTYYVETTVSQCASLRRPVNVNIITTVNVSNVTTCQGSTATINASGASSYQWYDAPSGGKLLSTSATYVTPVLNATTTYYIAGSAYGCSGYLTPVTVNVTPTPEAPTAPDVSVCAGSVANLTVNALNGLTYQWFTTPTGGTPLITSPDYTTPPLITSTTYYVQAQANGCPGPRIPVNVTVNPIPLAPVVKTITTCGGVSVTLSVVNPGGTNQWFSSPNSQTVIYTGDIYTTPVLNSSVTYYVENNNGTCVGPRGPATVIVEPIFPVPSASGQIVCSQSSITLTANTSRGTVQWFDAPTGGNLLATGTTYTTPPLTTTTTYYILATDGICSSARVPVTISTLPAAQPPTANGQNVCGSQSATLIASSIYNNYGWYDAPTGGNLLASTKAFFTPVLSTTTTYYVQTQFNSCISARTPVTVTVNSGPPPPTVTNTSSCPGSAVTLSASSSTGDVIQWYNASGILRTTGNTLTIANLGGDSTYYVQTTNGNCNSAQVTVTAKAIVSPNPGFRYSKGTFCLAEDDPTPTIYNLAGGTFTVDSVGLVFKDIHTGEIDLAASKAGKYTVTFTSNGCVSISSQKIRLVPEPNAQFSMDPRYCQTGGIATPSFPDGASAGVFSASPAGVVFFNTTSGDIDLANSQPGTYTITNSIVPKGACLPSIYSVQIIIDQVPKIYAGQDQTIFVGQTAQLAGTFSGTTGVTWSGGNGVFSNPSSPNSKYTPAAGETLARLVLTSNTSPATCGPQSSVVEITIAAYPLQPTAKGDTICSGDAATLIASGSTGVYQWYDAAAGGNLLATNAVFNTPPLTTSTPFYVQSTFNGATSPRISVNVTVRATTPPVANFASVCYNTAATLTATGSSSNTYYWYDAPFGGRLLSTNSVYVTNPLPKDTAFYVQTYINQCESSRSRIKVFVNRELLITSASSVGICNNTPLNYYITADTLVNLLWSRAAIPNISNPAVSNQTSSVITESLKNTSGNPVDVTYIITPSAGGCTGVPFNLIVTVYPPPVVSSLSSIKICNKTPVGYTIRFAAAPTSFTWSRAAVAGISNSAVSGQNAAQLNEELTNTTAAPIDVHYIYSFLTNNCSATQFDLTVTVNPDYRVVSAPNDTVCSGVAQNFVLISSINPTSFTVSRSAVPNISNPPIINQQLKVITEPLINTSSNPITVAYVIIPLYNGCEREPFYLYTLVNPQPVKPTSNSNSPVCLNSTIRLNTAIVNGLTYLWTGPNEFQSTERNPTISNVTKANAGVYLLTLINSNGCASPVDSTLVAVDDFPISNAGPDQFVCQSTNVIQLAGVISGGTTTGIWSTAGTGSFSPATNVLNAKYLPSVQDQNSGSVTLTLASTSKDDCNFALSTMTITFQPPPTADAGGNRDVCSQDVSVVLNGKSTNGSTVLWATSGSGRFSPSATVANASYIPGTSDIQQGVTTLTFRVNSLLCPSVTSTAVIKFIPPPTISAGENAILVKGTSYRLTPTTSDNNVHYLWSPKKSISNDTVKNPIIVAIEDITYSLLVTDARGCVSQSEVSIKVVRPLIIPNTFTPNGDGTNDYWDIARLSDYPNATVDIFTRYGQKVFHSDGYSKPWDGVFNGQPLPVGVYYYVINTKFQGGVYSGYVTILR